MMETHVINESMSPDDSEIWVMHCGAACFVLNDGAGSMAGTTVPPLDFYSEVAANKATCPTCRQRCGASAAPRASLVGA